MNRAPFSLHPSEPLSPLIPSPSPARGEGGCSGLRASALSYLLVCQSKHRVTVKLRRPCTLERFPLPLGEGQGEGNQGIYSMWKQHYE